MFYRKSWDFYTGNLMPSKNANHPAKGSTIRVEPIRTKRAIDNIKKRLSPRDCCLFTLGTNTAYRANELLSIRYHHVQYLREGDTLELKQFKTGKHRTITLNREAVRSIRAYLQADSTVKERFLEREADELFYSQKGGRLLVPSVSNMVKLWCAEAGLNGNYGSHMLRKTWGYWQYKRGITLPLLMEAFGHASQKQTLNYLCIQAQEVKALYAMEL